MELEEWRESIHSLVRIAYCTGLKGEPPNTKQITSQVLQALFDFLLEHKEYQRKWKGQLQILFGFSSDELDNLRSKE